MVFRDRVAGVHHRDQLTHQALTDAYSAAGSGLLEFTITVHSTYGGLALLPRLIPHVVSELQSSGFAVVNIVKDDWAYNAHLTVRSPVRQSRSAGPLPRSQRRESLAAPGRRTGGGLPAKGCIAVPRHGQAAAPDGTCLVCFPGAGSVGKATRPAGMIDAPGCIAVPRHLVPEGEDVGKCLTCFPNQAGRHQYYRSKEPDRNAANVEGGSGADPDAEQFERAMALSRSQPVGELGKQLTADAVISECRRSYELYATGRLNELWQRRLELGYGVERDGVPQRDFFYLNALAALAALRLGFKDHPAVPMCAGVAETTMDRSDVRGHEKVPTGGQV